MFLCFLHSLLGSPPHTWRKPHQVLNRYAKHRITSTYVEKTGYTNKVMQYIQDHLHIRGENCWDSNPKMFSLGSPPHTWRKRNFGAFDNSFFRITSTYVEKTADCIHNSSCVHRITSTYVEKTHFLFLQDQLKKDHLHIRGENPRLEMNRLVVLGSPPHTWRKQSQLQ